MTRRSVGVAATLAACTLLDASCRVASVHPERAFLSEAWDAYKRLYIEPAGNVLDRTRNGGETTSEGQGYALLRAVWMRDRDTFAQVLEWTDQHLRREDGLYSWRWGPADGGRILDRNTATDGDQEIAFALVLASEAFGNAQYLDRAGPLLKSIRTIEALKMPSGWIPAAGNWAVSDGVVNLSYLLPYAYPYFARVDPDGQWTSVVDAGYRPLARTRALPNVRLPPDFLRVRPDQTIDLRVGDGSLSTDFSFDAIRIYWRVALDCRLHQRMRACADPAGIGALVDLIARDGVVFTRYRVDGTVVDHTESLSFYGAIVPALADAATGHAIMSERLSRPSLGALLSRSDRYYDANWVWLGLALADGLIAERTPSPEAFDRAHAPHGS